MRRDAISIPHTTYIRGLDISALEIATLIRSTENAAEQAINATFLAVFPAEADS
jgi:hypothetical protein